MAGGLGLVRGWLLLSFIALAGCSDPAGPVGAGPGITSPDVLVGHPCPLTLPDGSPMSCDPQVLGPADMADRPQLADGWKCTHDWGEENVMTESYTTADGRVGFYWEWERWKEDGLAFQRLAWYEGEEVGESRHVAYQTRGFLSLPAQDPSGEVEIHNTFRQFRVHALVDGEWVHHPDNVTFLLDHVGGDTWWAVRFDWPGGPYYVSTMHEDRREGRYSVWDSGAWRGLVAGTEVIIDSTGNGIKYLNVDFTERRAGLDTCGALS